MEFSILKAWLLPSLSLLADGERTFSGNACIHFFQQNRCLEEACTRSQQICVCLFKLHTLELDPLVKADQRAQYVDDVGIAPNNATDLTRKIRAVSQCIRNAGLKMTIEKCHFRVRQVEFLGPTISSEGLSQQTHKIPNFLNKLSFRKTKKQFCNDIWGSWNVTGSTFSGWLKSSAHSINS